MGELYELKNAVEIVAARQGKDVCLVRGEVSRKAGFMLSLVNPGSADDPDRISRLKEAAFEILAERI